ncbi:MAG: peptidoglycan DD-metalloendopeptidase family protein [Marinifilaceae bacterium]
MKLNITAIRFLLVAILLCSGLQMKAQEYQSFEEYKKAEKARFQKYKENEKRKFEAFKRNELDWNKEILGYEVETPVSEKVEIKNKEAVVKPTPPKYVNLTATLNDEIVQIKRKINRQLARMEEKSDEEIGSEEAKVIPVKEEKVEAKTTAAQVETNQVEAKVDEVEAQTSMVETQTSKEEVMMVSKPVPVKENTSPKIDRESLIEAEKRSIPSTKPIYASYRLSSKFGNRFHPTLFRWRFHGGVDMACPKGTEIHVPADGVVVKSGWNNGYGNYIKIKHSNGFETVYGHLSKIRIKNGQKVSRGDVIGEVGSTGRSSGPHLHYEILKNKKRVNPERFFG